MGVPRNSNFTNYTALGLTGESETINSQVITGYQADGNGNLTVCTSTAVPTNGGLGYAIGCLCTVVNASSGTAYVNKGSATSCLFTLIV